MKKGTGKDKYKKRLLITFLISVSMLCSACSSDYVNNTKNYFSGLLSGNLPGGSAEETEDNIRESEVYADGQTQLSPGGVINSVSGMEMSRTVNDVFVSAGSGDIDIISDDDLKDIGVQLEKSGEISEKEEEIMSRETIGNRDSNVEIFGESKYAYYRLGSHEKKVYIEIYRTIQNMTSESMLSSLDVDEIDKCFNCVMIDNPEFFYLDGYKMTRTLVDGKLQSISFSPRYTMSGEEILKNEDYIDSYVNQFIKGMPELPDEYSKAKYIFDILVDNTEYDIESENSQNICSVFVNRKSVCQGYAMAAKYLADELGIFCTVVYGDAGGENHAWNIMRLDGVYCHVDITWGDTSYRNTSEDTTESMTDYVFLGATDEIIAVNHVVDSIVALPRCNSLDSYYFVREGKYFTEDDHDKLREVFDRAYLAGEKILTIRCADQTVYDEMDDYLFTQEKVFRYLRGTGKARYVRNRDELTMSFLLD